jgi:hypothetical protein
MGAFDATKEELTSLVPDSRAAYGPGFEPGSRVKGASTTTNIEDAAIAQIYFRFEDRMGVAEVYRAGDELLVHLMCPRCLGGAQGHTSQISSKRKQMSWENGVLNVEPFECPWEIENASAVDKQQNRGIVMVGANLCKLRIGIVDAGVTPEQAGRAVLAR